MKAGAGGSQYPYIANPPLTFRVTWTPSLVDDANYFVAISLNRGSGFYTVGTTTTGATQFDYQHEEYVQNGSYFPVSESFTFKVDVISRATYTSVSSSTASAIGPLNVGRCNALL